MAKGFNELKIWKKGFELLMKIYTLTSRYPKDERYCLVDQTRRAANSIIANIAESHGRYYFADKIRVLYTARGEVEETRSHLAVAFGRKYIEKVKFTLINKEYEGLVKGISSYINSLKRKNG